MIPSAGRSALERRTFAATLIAVTLVFDWALWPFAGAILWSVVAAIMFMPLNRRIAERLPGRPTFAAALTLLVFTAAVVIPALLLASFLLDRAADIYVGIRSGQIDIAKTFLQAQALTPGGCFACSVGLGSRIWHRCGRRCLPASRHGFRCLRRARLRWGKVRRAF